MFDITIVNLDAGSYLRMLEPGPFSLVLLTKNLKSTLGKYRGRGPGPERGRRVEQPMEARTLQEKPKGV